jgi:hypothetical protein
MIVAAGRGVAGSGTRVNLPRGAGSLLVRDD